MMAPVKKTTVDVLKQSSLGQVIRAGRGAVYSASNGFPAHKLTIVGVTGTDGKTTTCSLIYFILKSLGKKVGIISTIGYSYFDGVREYSSETGLHVTSPDSADIHKYLREMSDAGCEYAVLECTSHALIQSRFSGITIDVSVVTNITHEHLDYHETYEKYVMAKALLFKRTLPFYHREPRMSVAVINQDDKSWDLLKPYLDFWTVVGYGMSDFVLYVQ